MGNVIHALQLERSLVVFAIETNTTVGLNSSFVETDRNVQNLINWPSKCTYKSKGHFQVRAPLISITLKLRERGRERD